jgi:Cof subfamily protein (haloacid dehalogenase superfamily)
MTEATTTRDTSRDVRLVVADVDGTLVTPNKVLTPRARAAVHALDEAGIAFTITSGRPPRGMRMLIDELRLRGPIAAFNGGLFVRPDLSVIRKYVMPPDTVSRVVEILSEGGLQVWIYTETEWRVRTRHGLHVDREEGTVKFRPRVVQTFKDLRDPVVKIVGVSDDPDAMVGCAEQMRRTFGQQLSVSMSQPYYLDVTHPNANKGEVVGVLSELLGIPTRQIATVGDMPNDVPMFERSGTSIAMANASADVQRAATFVTSSNTEEGFARAMERCVLRAPAPCTVE